MAEALQLVADFTPDVKAGSDLRSYQFFLVCFNGTQVYLTDNNYGAGSGAVWVLGNKPNSGQPCQLVGGGNIYKTAAASTIARNQWLIAAPNSGMVGVGSAGSVGRCGIALMPTTVGSGELVTARITH